MYFYKVDSNILFSKNKLNGMMEIVPNTVEASKEKHIPVVNINENTVEVTIGSVIHPMEEKHYIEFIVLETNKGVYQQFLMPMMNQRLILKSKMKMLLVYMNTVIFMDYGQKSFNILITIDFLTLKNVLSKPILF